MKGEEITTRGFEELPTKMKNYHISRNLAVVSYMLSYYCNYDERHGQEKIHQPLSISYPPPKSQKTVSVEQLQACREG